MTKDFLPVSRADMEKRGWEQCDFVYISGDAYVDHPSFGHAIITRILEAFGYKVGIIAQPDWKDKNSITILGEPRLGFLVAAGNMDSMVNHYTVNKKRRHMDAFSPGGVMGKRPDYATIVYCNLIKQVYKKTPIIIGGIEASLRRMAHYDYWSDKVKRSILIDSGADIISYGMGEHSIVEIADALNAGIDVSDITFIKGTVYKAKSLDGLENYIELPSYDEICNSKEAYAKSFYTQYKNTDPFTAKVLVEDKKNLPEPQGTAATEPAVKISAALSPTILPIARITPDKIPGTAAGKTITNIVLSFPAPKPKLPSLNESGTAISASSVVLIIVGKTIIASVKTPAINEYPQCKARTNARKPNKPKTIEGIPANVSVVTLMIFTSFEPLFAYSTR